MANWEYEILHGLFAEVKSELNRLGALGWEIASTDVLPGGPGQDRLVVYLKRTVPNAAIEAPETEQPDLSEFQTFRPHT